MTKKLAITISGAVSLGSYEAGVLYELIRTIQHHNEHEADETKKIEIDVLTGASAGGMTAAIAAQKLLFEASSLQEPYNNSLYRAWVKDISFDSLINLQHDEDPTHSILSSNAVEDISKKHLINRYETQVKPLTDKHPAAADFVYLGLAMTNLNGVDYVRDIKPRGEFCYTRYSDTLKKKLSRPNDIKSDWEIIRNAAISCGAFPFAFRVKDLARDYSEYKNDLSHSPFLPLIPYGSFPTPYRNFTYTDGGTFHNEPLGLAKNLVDQQDSPHDYNDQRFYLFISPASRESTKNSEFNEKSANFSGSAKAIVSAIFNQARFHDWITAEQINEKIKNLDDRANQLSEALLNDTINPLQLVEASSGLLKLLFNNDIKLESARDRLKKQYREDYKKLSSSHLTEKGADVWVDTILVFETAADLGNKDEMQIFGITAKDEELAGGKLVAFLGFFDQSYRDHDYDVGRTKAREFIQKVNANTKVDLWFPYHPANDPNNQTEPWMNIREIDENLNNLPLSDVPRNLREKFRDRLVDRINDFMSQEDIPWLGRKALTSLIITPKLNKLLEL
ncbi:MAG: patatin-like phospholipase family protein [Methylococcales bacterium]